MGEDQKKDLVFRVMYLGESLRIVCQEIGFNLSTGKNVLQRYKKTGEYTTHKRLFIPTYGMTWNIEVLTEETKAKLQSCSLGILLLAEDNLQIVGSKTYSPAEEAQLMEMHKEFMKRGII